MKKARDVQGLVWVGGGENRTGLGGELIFIDK